MKNLYLTVVMFAGVSGLLGQIDADLTLKLKKTKEKIVLDGNLDEAAWRNSGDPADGFWQYFPNDTTLAQPRTEIFMTYDDKYLYMAAKCYSEGTDYVTPSLRRDFQAGGNDNITFLLDPYKDKSNAFVFGMNPFGVKREALISNGGNNPRNDWNGAWDNKWEGVSAIHDGYWSCEIAVPFSTLRFKAGEKEWYFNSYRFDTQSNTLSTWQHIPRNQIIMTLGHMGTMKWDHPLPKNGTNISIIPYLSAGRSRDIEDANPSQTFGYGGDAKINVTSGLNLDLTILPDFSQVEVDRQVINLDRFELFFPERRQFFLENQDLFGSFGDRRINPFFSRRIGTGYDPIKDERVETPIQYGARVSGKLDNNWRIGLLNMQTQREGGVPGTNFTVAAVQRKVFDRSSVGFILVNKETKLETGLDSTEFSSYNRVLGLDYNLFSKDNVWSGKFFYHHALTPNDKGSGAHGVRLQYNRRHFRANWEHAYVAEDYNAEAGFVPRTNYIRLKANARAIIYPKQGIFANHGPGLKGDLYIQPGFGISDYELSLYWRARYNDNGDAFVALKHQYVYLFELFDPSNTDAFPLPANRDFFYTYVEADYNSDKRQVFSYNLTATGGQFYNGQRVGLRGNLNYRIQPFAQIGLSFNWNSIVLPEPYADANLFLVGPRFDFTFTKKIFFTTFLQYNNQIDNFNINARFQWRFAPVSDLFIVYTNNFDTAANWQYTNRALVLKVNYWLNL